MADRNGTAPDWINVTASQPCPICGKPDWCSISTDGDWCRCNRSADHSVFGKGNEKQDAAGLTYWTYRLTPRPPGKGGWPEPQFGLVGGNRADPETLDRVYMRRNFSVVGRAAAG
jgi:hypothetical protein